MIKAKIGKRLMQYITRVKINEMFQNVLIMTCDLRIIN